MLIFLVKLILALVCGALDWWGGYDFLAARRWIMPAVLTLATAIFTHWWWALLFMYGPMAGCLTIGYGEDSWLYRTFGDAWARAIWLALVALAASVGLFISANLHLYFLIPYVAISGVLGVFLRKKSQVVGDTIEGIWLGSLLFIV